MSDSSSDSGATAYVVVHGHFYQPPRENPWLEAIEREASAAPYHNWNARIADECYRPNGRARIFNDRGLVTNISNNYTNLSFNFGATLLSWMQRYEPDIYRQILRADRESLRRHGGHGNAIAQGYSHAILPLCNARDRRTQIRWGKRDFSHRFGREPEALWLPETAICYATVDALIDEGLRYVILAPGQARRVRALDGEGDWTSVSGARIDPRVAYRIFSRQSPDEGPKRYIDAFFYDGPVSHAISFEQLLRSSRAFADRIAGAVDSGRSSDQLVHVAVDGETFGHHLRHADRALAYALEVELGKRGLRLTNYGEYLERHPPAQEVELEPGPADEGTAWSCVHGVGRWCRDCGCHAGSPPGWNQAWRAPLREAVNFIRDQAAELYIEMGGELLKDVWAARDDYIELLLHPTHEARINFIQRQGKDGAMGRTGRVLQLLEMQRHAMLAQTSCGWFFDDISGLEAVQVLRYGARAVQLLEELSGRQVESDLLEILGQARSNLPEHGTGADVYRDRALTSAVDSRRLVAQHAITDLHSHHPAEYERYGFRLRRLYRRELVSGPLTVNIGRLEVEVARTGQRDDLVYALIHFGSHDFHCAVRPFAGQRAFRGFTQRVEQIFAKATITELLRAVDAYFGEIYYGLHDLLIEEREEVLESLFGHLHESFGQVYAQLYEMHRRTIGALLETGLKMPEEFRLAAAYTLTRQLLETISAQKGSLVGSDYAHARELAKEAHGRGFEIDKRPSEALLGEQLEQLIAALVGDPTVERIGDAVSLLRIADELGLELPLERAQEQVFDALASIAPEELDERRVADFGQLMDWLRMSSDVLDVAPVEGGG